jgi:hypothetical protein
VKDNVKKARKTRAVLRDHFLPHPGNQHTPRALGHRALFSYSIIMVLLKFGLLAAGIALPAASLFSSAITPTNIISLTNASRQGVELPPLAENALLDASAQRKAEDMLAHQYFAHTSPDGATPWSWIKATGYTYRYAGENLAVYFTEAEDVQAGWMASPTHRANIVDTRYTEIGVGVAQGEYNGFPAVFVVEHFGKPTGVTTEATVPPTGALLGEKTEAPAAAPEPAITVTPQKDAYAISLKTPEAEAVSAHLGTASVQLSETAKNTWEGSLPAKDGELSQNGEQLMVVVSGEEKETTAAIALVAPNATAQDMYAFESAGRDAKIFGQSFGNLRDGVVQLYLMSIIVIATLLVITLIAKMHWGRLPLMGHAVAVIGIAIVLIVI